MLYVVNGLAKASGITGGNMNNLSAWEHSGSHTLFLSHSLSSAGVQPRTPILVPVVASACNKHQDRQERSKATEGS